MDKADLAVKGAAQAVIGAEQVRRLILAAQPAWRMQRSMGLTGDGFDVWRKGVLWDLCGKASFRILGQAEFGRALARFLELGGKEPAMFGKWSRTNEAIARRETGPEGDRRRAEYKLRGACSEFAEAFGGEEQARAYARAIMAKVHKTTVERATAKQIMGVFFTIRNRGAAKLRKIMREQAQ